MRPLLHAVLLAAVFLSAGCTETHGVRFNHPFGQDVSCTDIAGVGPVLALETPITLEDVKTYNLCKVVAGTPYFCSYNSAGTCP